MHTSIHTEESHPPNIIPSSTYSSPIDAICLSQAHHHSPTQKKVALTHPTRVTVNQNAKRSTWQAQRMLTRSSSASKLYHCLYLSAFWCDSSASRNSNKCRMSVINHSDMYLCYWELLKSAKVLRKAIETSHFHLLGRAKHKCRSANQNAKTPKPKPLPFLGISQACASRWPTATRVCGSRWTRIPLGFLQSSISDCELWLWIRTLVTPYILG